MHVADAMLTPSEVCERLRVSPRTLQSWRNRGGGPDFVRISATVVRYEEAAIERWLSARRSSVEAQPATATEPEPAAAAG